jgi:hypothetical protein
MNANSLIAAAAVAGLVSVGAYAGEAIDIGQTPEFQGSQTRAAAVVPAQSAKAADTRAMGAAAAAPTRATLRAEAIQASREGKIKSGELGAD